MVDGGQVTQHSAVSGEPACHAPGERTYLDGTTRTGEPGGCFAVMFRERADEVTAICELPVGGDF
jgi:hypothetical protein